MIVSKRLINQKKIYHRFFNKNGGKSKGIYKSLNCGLGSNDKKNVVKKQAYFSHSVTLSHFECTHFKICKNVNY